MTALRNTDFLIEVAKGNIPGHKLLDVKGHNESVGSSYEDVWEQGGDYTDSTAAVTHYISSSSAADTQDIRITYLDANWLEQIITVTLAGQTKVEIGSGITMIRIQEGLNIGSVSLAGDVYIYENDTLTGGVPNTATLVRAKLTILHNKTLLAKYAIPADKYGIIVSTFSSSSIAKDTDILLMYKLFGGVFHVHEHFEIYQNTANIDTSAYARVLPKSDIKYRAKTAGAGGAVSCVFGLLIVDSSMIGTN